MRIKPFEPDIDAQMAEMFQEARRKEAIKGSSDLEVFDAKYPDIGDYIKDNIKINGIGVIKLFKKVDEIISFINSIDDDSLEKLKEDLLEISSSPKK